MCTVHGADGIRTVLTFKGATLVRVPEIDGTFLEVETIVDEDAVSAALDDIRAVLAELGIGSEDLTRELYTDAVAAQRR